MDSSSSSSSLSSMLLPSILKQLITILFIFSAILSSISHCSSSSEEEEELYVVCGRPYDCGNLKNISYPFWGTDFRPRYCGRQGFQIECGNNESFIEINRQKFRVLGINQTGNIMKIARSDLYDTLCIQNDVVPITLNYTHFDYAPNVGNLTLIYGCQKPLSSLHNLTCYLGNGANQTIYYKADDPFSNIEIPFEAPRSCKPIKVPVLRSSIDMNSPKVGREELEKAVEEGFDVDYNYQVAILCKECEGSGGRCGSNVSTDEFLCYCHKSKPYTVMCRPGESK
ncbi:LEAF RUST 10 DISEASE-RESISTANCE LOCUS RECEPTOR-LIKE PROTEIN KINASE-like 2.7 [Ziziphus jujuba]|uniref:non-specific serine/threonine protein kinase n=1 Tax=Ziziphus jujuba TaxID=326968 RepID=A0ABM4A2N3_ZIZJJ|nr:LEAF RUST 10 DISEASE-RESISTANCE LOCUS RECEPTOR-LIKE PROTEIN KINASE-like 2.7 [Ziziphus jujuba]